MLLQRIFGATAVLALSTGLATAAPAAVERSANVRSGPGTGYPVVATLPRGTIVDAGPCDGGWCRLAWSEGEGYMARSLLALGSGGPAVAVAPGPYYDDYYDDYPYFGYAYGPSIGVTIPRHRWHHRHGHGRPGWGHHRPGRPGWAGRPTPPVTGNPGGEANKGFGRSIRSGGFASGGGASIGGGAKAAPSSVGGGAAARAPAAPAASAPAGLSGAAEKFAR